MNDLIEEAKRCANHQDDYVKSLILALVECLKESQEAWGERANKAQEVTTMLLVERGKNKDLTERLKLQSEVVEAAKKLSISETWDVANTDEWEAMDEALSKLNKE